MFENSSLIYSIVAISLLSAIFLFSWFRNGYIKSLHLTINSKEEELGKVINQLAAVKTMNKNLELTVNSQADQINKIAKVNKEHSDRLSDSYQANKKLIEDYQLVQEDKIKLENQLKKINGAHELDLQEKMKKLNAFEAGYFKLKNSYKIVQKSNENLCEERDFYRDEFIKLRKSVRNEDNIVQIKTA